MFLNFANLTDERKGLNCPTRVMSFIVIFRKGGCNERERERERASENFYYNVTSNSVNDTAKIIKNQHTNGINVFDTY